MKLSEIVKEQMSGGVQAAPSAAKPKIRSRSTGGQWQNGQTVPGTAPASGGVAQQPGSNPTSGGDPAGAMAQQQGSSDRYFQETDSSEKLVPEGIEGQVAYKGQIGPIVHQLVGGLRAAMGYVGAKDLAELHDKAEFVRITGAGLRESHVHDVVITRESPNYPSRV